MGGCGSDNDVRGIAGGCGVVGVCLDVVSFADSGSRSTSNCLSGGYSGISASCREVESIPMLTTGYSLASAADAMYAEIVVCRLVLASVQATLLGCDVVPPCLRCCACAVILSTGGGGGRRGCRLSPRASRRVLYGGRAIGCLELAHAARS